MSILSKREDDLGFHYGFIEGDHRQINVRAERRSVGVHGDILWRAYVGGEEVCKERAFLTKDAAEAAAIKWAKEHPDGSQ